MVKQRNLFTVKRLALDAVLVALYVLLGFLKIPIGNILRVNMASFAVVICAVAFSPIDGLIVGFMGEFLSQVLGPYGLTATTVIWSLPEAARGLFLGLCMLLLRRKELSPTRFNMTQAMYLFFCVATGLIASLLNTFALYVDSKMFGYYTYYMVFGILIVRLSMALVMSGLFGYVALYIVAALRANHLIKE